MFKVSYPLLFGFNTHVSSGLKSFSLENCGCHARTQNPCLWRYQFAQIVYTTFKVFIPFTLRQNSLFYLLFTCFIYYWFAFSLSVVRASNLVSVLCARQKSGKYFCWPFKRLFMQQQPPTKISDRYGQFGQFAQISVGKEECFPAQNGPSCLYKASGPKRPGGLRRTHDKL